MTNTVVNMGGRHTHLQMIQGNGKSAELLENVQHLKINNAIIACLVFFVYYKYNTGRKHGASVKTHTCMR